MLWGCLEDESPLDRELKVSEVVSSQSKQELIDEITVKSPDDPRKIRVQIKNVAVTQTVENLYQSEMIEKLVNKATSRNENNKLSTVTKKPMPKLIFPAEMSVELHSKRPCAPLSFIVPEKTDFTSGKPNYFPTISREIQKIVIKKSICGMLKAVGFDDASENSVLMLVDVLDDFLKKLMTCISEIKSSENSEFNPSITVMTLEKAFLSYQNTSLVSLLKHMKNYLADENKEAKEIFQNTLENYNKLKTESEEMYKGEYNLKLAFDMNQQFPGSFEQFLEHPLPKNNSFANDLACDFQDIISERMQERKDKSSGAVVELNIVGSSMPIHYPLDKFVEVLTESPSKDRKEKKFVKYCLNVKEGCDLAAVDPCEVLGDDELNNDGYKEMFQEGYQRFTSN